MADKRIGLQTIRLNTPPVITARATVVGHREGRRLGEYFDHIVTDDFGVRPLNWPGKMMDSHPTGLSSSTLEPEEVALSPESSKQIITSSFVARGWVVPS